MEASTLVAAIPPTDDPPDAAAGTGQDERSHLALQCLMDLADRYAHHLVAAADCPPGVLLLVHGIDLGVVVPDGSDVRVVPRLLARRRSSSVAVVVAAEGTLGGVDGGVVLVIGETSDGLRDERQFRVRARGRTRRLTRLPDHATTESPRVLPWLFPTQADPRAEAAPRCRSGGGRRG